MRHWLTGEAVDRCGQPVAGAVMTILEAPDPMPEMASMTGPDRRFRLSLERGRYRMDLRFEGRVALPSVAVPTDDAVRISVRDRRADRVRLCELPK